MLEFQIIEAEILEELQKSHPNADLRCGTVNRAMCLKVASIIEQIDILPGCTDLKHMQHIRARLVRLPSTILSLAKKGKHLE